MSRQRVTLKPKAKQHFRLYTLTILFIFAVIFGGSTLYVSTHLNLDPFEFYMNMANPNMRYVSIPAGLRREEIAARYKKVLGWSDKEVQEFINAAPKDVERGPLDGYFMPGSYWVNIDDGGKDVAVQMLRNFNKVVSEKILDKKSGISRTITKTNTAAKTKTSTPPQVSASEKINIDTAVRIASLIQREAAGGKDMKIISGIIWNRLFSGMSLEIDATLQYIKGDAEKWWPLVRSEDKYIVSPFNTYKNKGLPPTAIANPSIAAIEAAYNPAKTDCIFYIHDNNRGFHCSKTYEAHKENIQKYLIGSTRKK